MEGLQHEVKVRVGRPIRRGRVSVRREVAPTRVAAWGIGQAVRAARLRKKLTQEELGQRSGIARPNIARIEGGRHVPSMETLRRLADALRVSMDALTRQPTAVASGRDARLSEEDLGEWAARLEEEDRG
ncbi:MAG: helix-turn-helix transcriptional regulator [Deltaproteobacteria bacterium]|nr:helix-turn-helix transcriptional regulator [Deltaproteobacteria bacterium]